MRVGTSLLASAIVVVLWAAIFGLCGPQSAAVPDLVPIKGGEFEMGDVFDEGHPREKPVHKVRLGDFSLAAREVTVAEFGRFVESTGYTSSAEQNPNPSQHRRLLAVVQDEGRPPKERRHAYLEMLSHAGCFCYDPQKRSWELDSHGANWTAPRFAQTDTHPVTCISWNDAVRYCNWLSHRQGLPVAYDEDTGDLLDSTGTPSRDVTKVGGYRLPTEAEWEYAARERGRRVRFGNGRDTARSSEVNFDATSGDFPYLERGRFRARTTEVGAFAPNALGLYDMSGNVWEWCSDWLQPYGATAMDNPYGAEGTLRVARGGRWGGDASELRVSARFAWEPNNRCNNIGFRVARSKVD